VTSGRRFKCTKVWRSRLPSGGRGRREELKFRVALVKVLFARVQAPATKKKGSESEVDEGSTDGLSFVVWQETV
jgi:hypothetical protein